MTTAYVDGIEIELDADLVGVAACTSEGPASRRDDLQGNEFDGSSASSETSRSDSVGSRDPQQDRDVDCALLQAVGSIVTTRGFHTSLRLEPPDATEIDRAATSKRIEIAFAFAAVLLIFALTSLVERTYSLACAALATAACALPLFRSAAISSEKQYLFELRKVVDTMLRLEDAALDVMRAIKRCQLVARGYRHFRDCVNCNPC